MTSPFVFLSSSSVETNLNEDKSLSFSAHRKGAQLMTSVAVAALLPRNLDPHTRKEAGWGSAWLHGWGPLHGIPCAVDGWGIYLLAVGWRGLPVRKANHIIRECLLLPNQACPPMVSPLLDTYLHELI